MTQVTTYTHKYPEPLALLPNQIVTAEKLLDHIAERDVDLYQIVSDYLSEHYSKGCPNNFTEIGEAIIEIVRKHPNLWYNSPNNICIGEYRVQGYEWMCFIWSIRNLIHYHLYPEGDADDSNYEDEVEQTETNDDVKEDEEITTSVQTQQEEGYSPQLFQKFLSAVKKYVNSTDSVAEFMESNPTDLTDFRQKLLGIVSEQDSAYPPMVSNFKEADQIKFSTTVYELLNSLRPQIGLDQFKEFMSSTVISFVITPDMQELKESSIPLKAKMGKSKGLFFKYVATSEQFGPVFKMLTKYQKNKLNAHMATAFELEFQEILVTIEKANEAKVEDPTDVPTVKELKKALTDHFATAETPYSTSVEPPIPPHVTTSATTTTVADTLVEEKKVTFKDAEEVFDNPAPVVVSSEEFQQIIDAFEGKNQGVPPAEIPALKKVCIDADLSPASFELMEPPAPHGSKTSGIENFSFSSESAHMERSREADKLTQAEKLV